MDFNGKTHFFLVFGDYAKTLIMLIFPLWKLIL